MSMLSRICIGLSVFLLVAGAVYGLTSHEPQGATLLLISSATFFFLGMVARRLAAGTDESSEEADEMVHVGPTIWPFGFAVSAVILALGLIVSTLLLIPGAIGFAVCAAGWLRDVSRSHAHSD